ncbi:uncharacterized protein PODANS_3_2520 [Podospora anserina S mat+]|uniref:Podospora anserina S mat+ genomic DNA chromosome 3, supercontig 2 n=1 Tax=Podospora anserina (strain S / ATCC MYA-4624 / DSM 980 / FGSC 10383) TaxID=515849 RepID=B2AZU9_PODAN|nr:uncharacterized protein PODANS_3_2520 [Podospora anserina S mat+]CAP70149.1 unnamed protein product [Podospora anserina S mat+]CDP26741.1 Putative protein of unknown function [Podospora anserina S mat+]
MDFLNKVTGGNNTSQPADHSNNPTTTNPTDQSSSSGGGLMDKFNSLAGGGKESEKKEDPLDKGTFGPPTNLTHSTTSSPLTNKKIKIGVDLFQQHVLGQGDQSNESAIEQAKDEQISDFIRDQYKKNAGKDFPVADK